MEGRSAAKDQEDPITLVGLVFEVAAGLRRSAAAPLEQRHGLPPQSFDVLVRLARSPGNRLRMSDLASQASLTPSGLTRAVDRLEATGLVTRRACDEDRRGSYAELTPLGQAKMDEVLPDHRAQLESILPVALSPEERAEVVALLRRLRDVVNPDAARAPEPVGVGDYAAR